MPRLRNLTNQRFGKLVVIKRAPNKGGRFTCWLCQCECGKTTTVRSGDLQSRKTTSCGCWRNQILRSGIRTTHGLKQHALYKNWKAIKQRCSNKNNQSFKNYGGRGIEICQEWRENFEIFYNWAMSNGWEPGLQIDRIDNNGHYEPLNCHFTNSRHNCSHKTNTSKYGVGIYKTPAGKFVAQAFVNKKTRHIGTFKTLREAEQTRKKFIKEQGS